jgi:hypothetical protein
VLPLILTPSFIKIWFLISGNWFWKFAMNHSLISNDDIFFQKLGIDFKQGCRPPLARWPWIVMVFARKPHASFFSAFPLCSKGSQTLIFQLMLEDKLTHFHSVQNGAILPFNKNRLPHVENQVQKKKNIHAFLSRFNIEHRLQHLLILLYGKTPKKNSRKFPNQSLALKWLIEKGKKLPCIFHCDVKSHPDLVHRPIIWYLNSNACVRVLWYDSFVDKH